MNDMNAGAREEAVRRVRICVIAAAVCEVGSPILFWGDIRRLQPLGLAVFAVGYVIIGTGVLWLFVRRYTQVKRGDPKRID